MAEKVEIEKPVVSKELAERFSYLEGYYGTKISLVTNIGNYVTQGIPEYSQLSMNDFETLLAKMYVLNYEIKKPKLKHIKLNSNIIDDCNYLNLTHGGFFCISDENNDSDFKTQFTQAEADEFLKDEPVGMWVVEEVED